MLTDELATRFGEPMGTRMIRQTAIIAFVTAFTTVGCTAERSLAPNRVASSISTSVVPVAPQIPLLYVVDGVKLERDRVPALASDQIASVRVIKGHRALAEYGPDASYGVVVITTKLTAPRT